MDITMNTSRSKRDDYQSPRITELTITNICSYFMNSMIY
jgi:hypothetical protein